MIEDDPDSSEAPGLWMTISELAAAKDLGRSAVSERVLRLEEQGLLTTRPGKGRTKLVNVAEFDRVVGQVTDLAREQGAATRRGAEGEGDEAQGGAGGAYTREQAKRMAYLAEISRLDLEERLGNLVRVDELRPVIEVACASAARVIDSLVQEADALREAAQSEDAYSFDRVLKDVARRLRTDVAAEMRKAMPGR